MKRMTKRNRNTIINGDKARFYVRAGVAVEWFDPFYVTWFIVRDENSHVFDYSHFKFRKVHGK